MMRSNIRYLSSAMLDTEPRPQERLQGIRPGSIHPGYEPAHPMLVAAILGELLPEPAFFTAGFGIKERGKGQGSQEGGPASPGQCPANRPAEYCRVERVAHERVN